MALDLQDIQSALGLKKVTFSFGSVPFVSFDCSISETHRRESVPTEFAIENGQTIADHIVIKPFSLKLQALISNTPLSNLQGILSGAITTAASKVSPNPAVLKAKAGAVAALPLIPQISNPAISGFSQLLVIQGLKLPFKVTTSLLTYNNMWIRSLSVPRESKTGNSVIVDIELVQLLLVKASVTDLGSVEDPNVAAKKKEEGDQSVLNKALEEAKKNYAKGLAVYE